MIHSETHHNGIELSLIERKRLGFPLLKTQIWKGLLGKFNLGL